MNKKILIFGLLLSGMVITSCVNDLDVKPNDPNSILAGNLSDNPVYMK